MARFIESALHGARFGPRQVVAVGGYGRGRHPQAQANANPLGDVARGTPQHDLVLDKSRKAGMPGAKIVDCGWLPLSGSGGRALLLHSAKGPIESTTLSRPAINSIERPSFPRATISPIQRTAPLSAFCPGELFCRLQICLSFPQFSVLSYQLSVVSCHFSVLSLRSQFP